MKITNMRKAYFQGKIKRMSKQNRNWIAVFVGPTGSGKTYAAIETADYMMDYKIDPQTHIVFSIEEFMNSLNKGVFKKGDIVVFEEAGVNISSKNWQSRANKNINFVLQTCRHRNFGIIFTLPVYKFLDSSTRSLIHTAFVMDDKSVNYSTKTSYPRVYDFKLNSLNGVEPYTISPKFIIDGAKIVMHRVACKYPREELITNYEKRKTEFTDRLNKEIEDQLKYEQKEKDKKVKSDVASCSLCSNSDWYYLARKQLYRCKRCGNEISTNPYTK